MRIGLCGLALLAACGGGGGGGDDGPGPDAATAVTPTQNAAREIAKTEMSFDVTALSGVEKVTFVDGTVGGTLEVGDLTIDSVKLAGADLAFAPRMTTETTKHVIDLALPTGEQTVEIAYHFKTHASFDGYSSKGFTLVWPYYCGNLFPCHSEPADGVETTLALTGVPTGKMAIFPPTISEAPSYMAAFTIDDYTELPLGTTTAGTQISAWYRPNGQAAATAGSAHLVAAFDWYEKNIGPYRFGTKAGSVSVNWGSSAGLGGMEHHPFWHIGTADFADEETHAHEAAHGWYGDGIRLACWEDFVLSEGTVSYLAARSLTVVAPTVGEAITASYKNELATSIVGTDPVWPEGCNQIDVINDNLFTRAPYVRGALFYQAVADKVGADKVDMALETFYTAHAGKTGSMADMLTTLTQVTGYDVTACAQIWLRSTTVPTYAACN
jgi:aminopeptidase N